ncbi:MAG: preprotein translocase subunit SecG [Gemmatimonadota bacterium]|nr:preprotein translocase subunit SecG [Gemmatimonadota bacterium]
MYTFLVVLVVIVALLLIAIVLLQSGKGGGLAAEFGGASSSTDSIIGSRQAANVLTRATWIGGGVLLFLSIVLAILSARTSGPPESILRSEFGAPAGQRPASVLESESSGGEASLLEEAGAPATGGEGAAGEQGTAPAEEPGG